MKTRLHAAARILLRTLSLFLCFAPAGGARVFAAPLVLQNEALLVELDPNTGAFARVENRVTGQTLLRAGAAETAEPPWTVRFRDEAGGNRQRKAQNDAAPLSFHAEPSNNAGGGLRLAWEGKDGIGVEVQMSLPPGAAPLEATATAPNGGQRIVESFTYPILRGLQPIGQDPSKTFLAAPYMEGHLFRDPFALLDTLGPARPNLFAFTYPRGHNLTMQFFGLYEQERGGFYLATHDGRQTVKGVTFGVEGKTRFFSVTQQNWDCRPGQGMALDYPFVLAALTEGSWQEAADRYKQWAAGQPWAARRVAGGRDDVAWLYDKVGFSVFGIGAFDDQRPWYEAFHDIAHGAGAKVLFVAAGNWRQLGDPGATADAAPPAFRQNMETVRKNEDAIVPFYFDMRTAIASPSWTQALDGDPGSPWNVHAISEAELANARQEEAEAEFGGKATRFLCPTEQAFVEAHRARDERLMANGGFDGAYYDISINLAPVGCFDSRHAHPPGWGRWIFDAYRRVFDESRRGGSAAAGRPIILGTEQITEGTLDTVDFYHLGGAGLGPIRKPGGRFDAVIMSGQCRQIPLLEYVYHEAGPLRTGGKIQISTDFGDAWYYITGQEYLWGGVIELIYFNAPLELFAGTKPPTLKTGFGPGGKQWENNPRTADPKKIEFLQECAAMRVGPARDFLCHGVMLRQPPVEGEIEELRLPFWHYADIKGPASSRRGDFPCPELLREAWRAPDGRVGLFFVNLQADKPLEIDLPRERLEKTYGLSARFDLNVRSEKDIPSTDLEKGPTGWRLNLPPRRPMFIEISP